MLLFDAILMEITRLFMRLEAECSIRRRQFTVNDAVLPFPLHASLNRVDAQLDISSTKSSRK